MYMLASWTCRTSCSEDFTKSAVLGRVFPSTGRSAQICIYNRHVTTEENVPTLGLSSIIFTRNTGTNRTVHQTVLQLCCFIESSLSLNPSPRLSVRIRATYLEHATGPHLSRALKNNERRRPHYTTSSDVGEREGWSATRTNGRSRRRVFWATRKDGT